MFIEWRDYMNKLELYIADANDLKMVREWIRNDSGIRNIFYGHEDRFELSELPLLIYLDKTPIGFLSLVEERLRNVKFLDIGILEEYRGCGYAIKATSLFLEIFKKKDQDFVIAETKVNNEAANKVLSTIGMLVNQEESKNLNYYLMQPERKDEFMNGEVYNRFKRHCIDGAKNSIQLMHEIMEESYQKVKK